MYHITYNSELQKAWLECKNFNEEECVKYTLVTDGYHQNGDRFSLLKSVAFHGVQLVSTLLQSMNIGFDNMFCLVGYNLNITVISSNTSCIV